MPDEDSDSLKLFHMKRSASGEAKKLYQQYWKKPEDMTYEDLFEIMQCFWIDQDKIQAMAKKLLDMMEAREDLTPEVMKLFRIESTVQYAKKTTFQLDPTSRLLMMGTGDDKDYQSWMQRYPDCLVSNFKKTGTYGAITGPPRSGKTDFACLLMEVLMDPFHMNIITNIKIDDPPEGIIYVTKVSELVRALVENKKSVVVLDETGSVIPKKRALSKRNINYESLTRYIGKLDGRLIMITQDFYKDIPTLIQGWITERYKKKGIYMVDIDLTRPNGYVKLHKIFRDLPKTKLKYRTEDITGIEFDLDIDELLQKVASSDNKGKAILKYIDKLEKDTPDEIEVLETPEKDHTQMNKDLAKLIFDDEFVRSKCITTSGNVTLNGILNGLTEIGFQNITQRQASIILSYYNKMMDELKSTADNDDEN